MLDRENLIEIASGEKRGIGPSLARGVLWFLSLFYRCAVGWRNRRFDQGRDVTRVDVPVVSIGNLTTGGTGKSPLVIWIARYLRELNLRVAVLSRGYGAKANQVADEAIELEQRLSDVPHLQNPNRVASAQIAIDELEMQVLVLDDAFQHRKIDRDLNVVLVDATRPFGFGFLLPRGLLREPISSLRRADLIVISRCDQVTEAELEDIEEEIRKHSDRPLLRSRTVASHCLQADGRVASIDSLVDKKVFGFCGIGNPENFWATLERLGFSVQGKFPFPDHHRFDREDVNRIGESAGRQNAELILCTHKDLVKLDTNLINEIPVYALVVDLEFLNGEEVLKSTLRDVLDN